MKRTWLWVGAAVLVLGFLYLPSLGIGVGQILAFLVLLLCPLMHFLGGHRHGAHRSGDSGGSEPAAPGSPEIRVSKREDA